MGPIRDLKGVQKVSGCLAALSRFISRLDEKGLPLYRLLKKHERLSWTVEAQEALDKLKATLANAPILTPPQDGEPLYLYVAATTQVVSPITNLRAEQAVTFFTDIIYRFGVPNSIITDNGSQFMGRKFLELCDKFHIRVDWAAVAHPQTNGQVEHANGMIIQGLKPRIFDRLNKSSRKWLQELPAVVWSLRTTPSRATGFTPFFLVYGTEAILPTDLEYMSPRVRGYDKDANQRAREDSLDQLDEARTVALMHSARYQQTLRRYQAQKMRRRDFSEGDLVLRLRQDNRGHHKLSPPWEGPYVVVKVLKLGTYKLANEDGEELANAWNIQQLCRFYP
jgi:hypothetical protein